ncbi:DUF2752 domain-containing protein [Planctomycetota bacterium]
MQTSQQLNKSKFILGATARQRKFSALVFLGIFGFFSVFAAAGHYQVDMGTWLGQCGFKQDTGYPCPTCEMTTATLAFAQGKITEAFYIQPACAFLCSLLVIAGIFAFIIAIFGVYFHFITQFFTEVKLRYMILALIIIIAAGWVVTLARVLAEKNIS